MTARSAAGPRLRAAFDLLAPGIRGASARMWAAGDPARTYSVWLRTQYQVILGTTSLLAFASAECRRRAGDPLAPALAGYFAGQLVHERGHEDWVAADYAAAGGDPDELARDLPDGCVARFAGAQFHWIGLFHPVALLGHIALLEWLPPDEREIKRRSGLPPAAFRTIAGHGRLDAGHGEQLRALLGELRLTEREHSILLRAFATSAGGLAEVIASVCAAAAAPPGATPLTPGRHHG